MEDDDDSVQINQNFDLNDPNLWSDDEDELGASQVNPYSTNEENPIKQLRKDLDAASPFRGRARRFKKKKSRLDNRTQPDYADAKQLGIANQAYVEGRLETARQIVSDIIKSSPHVFEAWRLLGQVAHDSDDRENCHTAWLYAAGLRERDGALWEEVAKVALELGKLDDADYAYTRACRMRPEDEELVYRRLEIHLGREGSERQQIECYRILLKTKPHDMQLVKELAKLYMDINKPVHAVEIYEAAAKYWTTSLEPDAHDHFTWNELNIMAEVYDNAAAGDRRPMYWSSMISQIKTLGIWLCGDEVDMGDDAAGQEEALYESMPIDLHLWLAKAKFSSVSDKAGEKHVDMIKAQGDENAELLVDTARMLTEIDQHRLALTCYDQLKKLESGEYEYPEFLIEMAKCALANNQLDTAKACLQDAVSIEEESSEAWLLLAEVYERLHSRQLALTAINRYRQIRRERGILGEDDDDGLGSLDPLAALQQLQNGGRRLKKSTGRVRIVTEMSAAEEMTKSAEAEEKFGILHSLHEEMLEGPGEALDRWLEIALELIEDFRGLPAIWRDKSANVNRSQMPKQRNLADRLAETTNRLEQDGVPALRNPQDRAADALTLRGQHVLVWLELFIQTALCLELVGNGDEAIEVLDLAIEASVFRLNEARLGPLLNTKLLVALKMHSGKVAIETVRSAAFRGTLHGDWLRYGMAAFAAGDWECMKDDATQKAYLRGLKTIDLVSDPTKDISDTQIIRDFRLALEAQRPSARAVASYYYFYGNIMAASKSHVPALHYYVRAWETDRETAARDPLLSFQIGLAYLQRSMQRQTDNRQWQVVQGMYFLQRYHAIRSKHTDPGVRQEADYNMAKAYHHLGLSHLATPLYEKVLKASDTGEIDYTYDLAPQAAFNLHLIYFLGGATRLARHVLHHYNTI